MPRASQHKQSILTSALLLFRRKGYSATGLNEILARSGAPKGSLYHYFPLGKEEIGVKAIECASLLVSATLEKLAETSSSPAEFVKAYGVSLEGWMRASEFRDGCPITTILLETVPDSVLMTAAGADAFQHWQEIIQDVLITAGQKRKEAAMNAALVLSSMQGALILSRVQQDVTPIRMCTERLSRLL